MQRRSHITSSSIVPPTPLSFEISTAKRPADSKPFALPLTRIALANLEQVLQQQQHLNDTRRSCCKTDFYGVLCIVTPDRSRKNNLNGVGNILDWLHRPAEVAELPVHAPPKTLDLPFLT